MSKKTLINLFLVIAVLLTLGVNAASAAPLAQPEEMTYTVKLGDNLWTLAEKYLGSGSAYWDIVNATNAKHDEDTSFAYIENPDLIHPGWKLFIPIPLPVPLPQCVDFEDLSLGTRYGVGDLFPASGVDISASDFKWGTGSSTSAGFTKVGNAGLAGGSGQEMIVNNILLKFDFGGSVSGLSLRFGEYGGNLNIDINGKFVNFQDFADIDGTVIGGVDVSVVNGLGNDQGTLTLLGAIDSFAVGGQELFIDDVCPAVDKG